MAGRKNLVLASLVSLVMALSFSVGVAPMLTVGPDQSAKAAQDASEVFISADGSTSVGASYAIPVGGEQSFLALQGAGEKAAGVTWSLTSDGSAQLVSGPQDETATVRATARGRASLSVRSADGLSAVVELTFHELKADPVDAATSVRITAPADGARVVFPAGATSVSLPLTAAAGGDAQTVAYFVNGESAAAGQGVAPTYVFSLPGAEQLPSSTTITAKVWSASQAGYAAEDTVTFAVVQGTDDEGDGLPDDLTGIALQPGDEWRAAVSEGAYNRRVAMTPLKASESVSLTLADPSDSSRWVRVTAAAGLIEADREALLLVAAADTTDGLLGAADAAELGPEPAAPLTGGQYVSIDILVNDGGVWSSMTDATAVPVTVEMAGVAVAANESAAFAVHPVSVVFSGGRAELAAALSGGWTKAAEGTQVNIGLMTAELRTLGVVAPYAYADSPNILSIVNTSSSDLAGTSSAYSTGGEQITVQVSNVQTTDAVSVSVDGATVASSRAGGAVTFVAPRAGNFDGVSVSADLAVRVTRGAEVDFDVAPNGLTFVAPAAAARTSDGGNAANADTKTPAAQDAAKSAGVTDASGDAKVLSPVTLTTVAPRNVAPPAGGLTIYLRGTNFVTSGGTTRVFFTAAPGVINASADIEATQVTVHGATELEVVTPAHAAGTFDVYAQTAVSGEGTQTSNLLPFVFAAPTLTVSGVNPNVGPVTGGTQVTISGSNLPDVGSKAAKQATTGTILQVENAVYNVFSPDDTVTVDLTLFRGPNEDFLNGPAAISASILFDTTVLEFVSATESANLISWYGKEVSALVDPDETGKLNLIIVGTNAYEITTYDNQIAGGGHNPNAQINPFPLGSITFRVLKGEDLTTPLEVSRIRMVDSAEPLPQPVPGAGAEDGSVRVTSASAELQLEDPAVHVDATTVDMDMSLFRPDGANLTTGPASMTVEINYDQSVLTFTGLDPSTQVVDWYGKNVTVNSHDPVQGVVTLSVTDGSMLLQQITSVNPDTQTQLNPFPLGTLHFDVNGGANLSEVSPVDVTALTMRDTAGDPFSGGSGVGEQGIIRVTQMPTVYFGAKEAASVGTSTSTAITAETPVADRRGTVDVLVIDPTLPGPGNYGFLANSYTYQEPVLSVSPAGDFSSSGNVGSTIYAPANAIYQIYNEGNIALNWTVSANAPWLTVSPGSGIAGAGESDSVTVAINAQVASGLVQGTYTATVTFAGDGGTATREVTLTIEGTSALRVEPQVGVEFTGPVGGGFQPATRAFSVANVGGGTLTWTAVSDKNWLTVSPASGSNTGTVTVSPNAQANVLAVGTHVANVTFTSSGGTVARTVTLVVAPAGVPAMVLTPEAELDGSGRQGGPFTPSTLVYTVQNVGAGLLMFNVTDNASWLSVINGAGSLVGGASAGVVISIDSVAAGALEASDTPYTATVTFDDGVGATPNITRTVTLDVFNIALVTPNGGEEFARGDVVPIQWTYAGSANANNMARVELLDNGAVVATLAAAHTNVQGLNTLNWLVPEDADLARNLRIRVTSTTDNRAMGMSEDTFSIIDPAFEVVEPAAGETVSRGKTATIRWRYTEVEEIAKANEAVDIYLYRNDEALFRIAEQVKNDPFDLENKTNSYDWAVPAALETGSGYRIIFRDGDTVLGGTPLGEGFTVGAGGPCFIATAAYGTPMASQIDSLRDFRDMYLLTNPAGIAVADVYYQVSPAIADVVARHPALAALIRVVLAPVVFIAKLAVTAPALTVVPAGFGALLMGLRRYRRSAGKA